mgnify:CR=1 FL=1
MVVLAVCAALVVAGRAVFVEPTPVISGTVISQGGLPVAGATVSNGDDEAVTAGDGTFELDADEDNEWVTATHPDFETRVRAARRGEPVLIRLTPDPGSTVTMHFTGDVMFGRRFYDPNEDGDPSDALLTADAGLAEHFELLRPIEPLLSAADLTIVNLETPLIDDPTFPLDEPRPDRLHPTKEFAFASEPAAAAALRAAGVDVVDLGNNHLYDAMEAGVTSTISALDAEGLAHYGAGLTEEEAWAPAVAKVGDTTIAFLGCTTVTGEEHAVSYVAGPGKGGAARCDEQQIRTRVAAAAAANDTVVFSIHGGFEYQREPSANVQQLSQAAREAGARVVVNHHPHVTGGFDWTNGALTAWTMGNFVFDQSVWPTFGSYLLAVGVRDDEVVRAYAEPLMIERYLPRGLTGARAVHVAREAAGRAPGPFLIEDGAMEVDLAGAALPNNQTVSLAGGDEPGTIMRIHDGTSISAIDPNSTGAAQHGRDLLAFGTFENEAVDPDRRNGSFWELSGDDRRTSARAAYRGASGVELSRDSRRANDAALTPLHRVLVSPGTELSITGMVSTVGDATVIVQLSWYQDTRGSSVVQTLETLVDHPDAEWRSFRLDVTVPESVVAVGLFIRLLPPEQGLARARLDDLAIIEWAPADAAPSALYDHVRIAGSVDAVLSHSWLAGAERWARLRPPEAMPEGSVTAHVVTVPIAENPGDEAPADDG